LLAGFGLQAPSKVPPQLLRALALERLVHKPWKGCEDLHDTRKALLLRFRFSQEGAQQPWAFGLTNQQVKQAESAAAWRKLLVSVGVDSKAQLLQLKSSAEGGPEEQWRKVAAEGEALDPYWFERLVQ
jgi:hypothetical protein